MNDGHMNTKNSFSPSYTPPAGMLNLAHVVRRTTALGRGEVRSVVWFQGCPLACPGCIAPEWQAFKPALQTTPQDLAAWFLRDPDIQDLTLSGGEPTLQSAAAAVFLRLIRREREVRVICFSGYTYEHLRGSPPAPGVDDLLAQVDVLVDGSFQGELAHTTQGLRGSSNQNFIYLTDRIPAGSLEQAERKVEIHLHEDSAVMVGIPRPEVLSAFHRALAPRPLGSQRSTP